MIRQGVPFIANKNMLFCIVEDTADGTYRTINLSMGSIHGCNYPTIGDALEDLQKSWKIEELTDPSELKNLFGNKLSYLPNYNNYEVSLAGLIQLEKFSSKHICIDEKPLELARYRMGMLEVKIEFLGGDVSANLVYKDNENEVLCTKSLGFLDTLPKTEEEFINLVKETAMELSNEFEKNYVMNDEEIYYG